ncbi:hypothetical protein D3C71_24750 [compost metagenome]
MSTAVPSVSLISPAARWSLGILGVGALSFLLATVITYDPASIWSHWKAWVTRVMPGAARTGLGLAVVATAMVLASALLAVLSQAKLKSQGTIRRLGGFATWAAVAMQAIALVALLLAPASEAHQALVAKGEATAGATAVLVALGVWVFLAIVHMFVDDYGIEELIEGMVEGGIVVATSPWSLHTVLIAAAGTMAAMREPTPAVATALTLLLPFSLLCILAREVANRGER